MLVVNTIIISTITILFTEKIKVPIFPIIIPILGLIFCIIWLLLFLRGSDYSNFYIKSARELEDKYLSDVIKTISNGEKFSNGSRITFEIKSSDNNLKMNSLARLITTKTAAILVIVIFIIVYLSFIF